MIIITNIRVEKNPRKPSTFLHELSIPFKVYSSHKVIEIKFNYRKLESLVLLTSAYMQLIQHCNTSSYGPPSSVIYIEKNHIIQS